MKEIPFITEGLDFTYRIKAQRLGFNKYVNVSFEEISGLTVNHISLPSTKTPVSYSIDEYGRLIIPISGEGLACNTYGLELTGFYNNGNWRRQEVPTVEIVKASYQDNYALQESDDRTIDITITLGETTVSSRVFQSTIDAVRKNIADSEGVGDVKINGRSIVETNPTTGKKEVNLQKDMLGKVDDVKVNGESVLNAANEANIVVPMTVEELSDSSDFAKKTDLQTMQGQVSQAISDTVEQLEQSIDDATVSEVEATVDNNTGTPEVDYSFENGKIQLGFKNLKGEKGDKLQFSDLTEAEKGSLKGATGESAVFDPNTGNIAVIKQTTGGDIVSPMSQNAVSEALGSQALGSGLYEEVATLSKMSELAGITISNTGIITTSSVSGAKIAYFEVSSGDIVKINILAQSANRVAWGLFPSLEVDTEALQYENYVANDLTIGKDYLFHVASAGYFAIYSLNAYDVTVLRGKGGMTTRKIPFNTYSGGGIYANAQNASKLGKVEANVYRRHTDFIDVSENKRLLYARQSSSGSGGDTFGMAFYDSSKAYIGGEPALKNQPVSGYVLTVIDVPSNAKYARFSLWESTSLGEFFLCDADADAMGVNIVETITADVSAKKIALGGRGTIAVSSQKIYAKPERVLRFVLDDNDVPLTDSSTDERFVVAAFDSTDNLVENLYMVKNPDLPRKEILVVTPQAFDHIKVAVKCNEGEEYRINISDVTDSYTRKKLDGKDIKSFSPSGSNKVRRYVLVDAAEGNILRAFPKNATNYNTACYLYKVEEHVASYAETPSSFVDNVRQAASYGNGDFLNINFKKGEGEAITKEDVLAAYDIYLYYLPKENYGLHLKDNERRWEFYGFSEYISSSTDRGVRTNYLAIPKVGMSVRMDIPKWLRVRFKYGKRDQVGYTDYFYSGDVCTFNEEQVAVFAEFSCVDLARALDKDFYDESMSLTILDENDGNVFQRNMDTEKWLGAIEATPNPDYNYANDLPLLAHVSDVHGDNVRFKSACDYADYLGVDLLINTGDNPFLYVYRDGTDFVQEIMEGVKSDYAGCLGNHDTYIGTLSISTIYNTQIAPFAEKYGWHKESDSDVTNKCYYYKDLETKSLRIIALDIYEDVKTSSYKARISQTQIEWFIATLASTPEGYGVIVIMHQAPHGIGTIEGKSQWNDSGMTADCASIDSDYMTNAKITGNPFGKIIDAFIGKTSVSGTYSQKNAAMNANETISYSADFSNVAEGVEFICYLNGHTHRDWVGYVKDCEHNQLNINLCSAAPISQGSGLKTPTDIFRDSNGVNQDAFNVYTINRVDKTVGIIRIGSCITKGLQERRVTFVSYV